MRMFMSLFGMLCVPVVVRAMLTRMVMIVRLPSRTVRMLMAVFVKMPVRMLVSVLMRVLLAVMFMFVRMNMVVLMGVKVFVLVFAFHGRSSYS